MTEPFIEKLHQKYEVVGHCGRIFHEFQVCDEPKLDDLCTGCCMNDEEEVEEYYE